MASQTLFVCVCSSLRRTSVLHRYRHESILMKTILIMARDLPPADWSPVIVFTVVLIKGLFLIANRVQDRMVDSLVFGVLARHGRLVEDS